MPAYPPAASSGGETDAAAPATLVELTLHLVRGVVEHPESVRVVASGAEGATVLQIHVAAGDVGQVIGRQGRIIQAIRTVVRAAALRRGERVGVEVVD